MASIPVLKLGAVALIGLGAADLAWINVVLGPRVLEPDRAAVVASSAAPARPSPPPPPPPPPPPAKIEAPKVEAPKVEAPKPAPPQPAPPPATLVTIYFDSSSRRVGSTARAKLADAAARAGAHGILHLEGHTDVRGEDTYNDELSKRRVDNCAAALIKQGFDAERIVRTYVGKRGSGETANTELWRDRRVDIWIEGGTE